MRATEIIKATADLVDKTDSFVIERMWYEWSLIPFSYLEENNEVWLCIHSSLETGDAVVIERAFRRMKRFLRKLITEADKNAKTMSFPERTRLEKELLPDLSSICKRWMTLEKETID